MAIYSDEKHNENMEYTAPKQVVSDKEYIEAGGSMCPFCKSEEVVGGQADFDFTNAYREAKCNNCGEEWEEIFEMTGLQEKFKGRQWT